MLLKNVNGLKLLENVAGNGTTALGEVGGSGAIVLGATWGDAGGIMRGNEGMKGGRVEGKGKCMDKGWRQVRKPGTKELKEGKFREGKH